jgi:endonuclease YncB( thermonuclease family)
MGPAQVVDTGTLSINGEQVVLAGIIGKSGTYAAQLQSLIDSQGPAVSCTLQRQGYLCLLPSKLDIARAALFNGAGEPSADASDDYRQQAQAARAAHRGIWR